MQTAALPDQDARVGRTSRRKRSLIGRTRTVSSEIDGGSDVDVPPASAPIDPPDVPEPGPTLIPEDVAPPAAEPDPGPTLVPEDDAPPAAEPVMGLAPADLPPAEDDEPSTEDAPHPHATPAPEMRFVPKHRMLRGHVREPDPEPLLTEAELRLALSLVALASGFTFTGGGGLLLLWWNMGDDVFRVFGAN